MLYLLIGLAHTIIAGIFTFTYLRKHGLVHAKERFNELYDNNGWNISLFSGEETYRSACAGLVLVTFIWPIYDVLLIYSIIKN